MAHIIIFALTVKFQSIVVLRFGGGAVTNIASGLHRCAGQRLAPDVESIDAEAAAQPLFDRDLHSMVIR